MVEAQLRFYLACLFWEAKHKDGFGVLSASGLIVQFLAQKAFQCPVESRSNLLPSVRHR